LKKGDSDKVIYLKGHRHSVATWAKSPPDPPFTKGGGLMLKISTNQAMQIPPGRY
jgi:hypothetical protein